MRRVFLCASFLALGAFLNAHASSFFELDGANGFYGSPGVPNGAVEKLQEAQRLKNTALKCVAFTPAGDWIVLFGGNGVWSSNTELPAVKKLAEFGKDAKADLKCVAFAPGGGWTLFFGQNGNWTEGNVPADAFAKVTEVGKAGGTFRSIAYAPNGGWVLLYDKHGASYGGVPDDLAKVLAEAVKKSLTVHCVSFAPNGDWICLTSGGWWTSNTTIPASKYVDFNIKNGHAPKWLAFVPEPETGAGPYKLETKPTRRVVATLTTDIAHPDATVDEWYLYAPEVPNLPSQEKVKTTFSPEGTVVKEASAEKRPFFLTRISDGRKEVHTVLTIEATLMSRHLIPLSPGEKGPEVKDLPAADVALYTTSSPTLDFDTKKFQDWMNHEILKRKANESDMLFAHRAFAYIKHHFTYQFPTPFHSGTETCAAGKSDCGGLSALFASLMRANGVPARLLGGRWAQSQTPDYGQWHVKAEFFAKGVGWVPVDSSGAVGDIHGSDFACFGHDGGDHIAFVKDQAMLIDSFIAGQAKMTISQGIFYWWRGSGADKNGRFEEKWTVEKK